MFYLYIFKSKRDKVKNTNEVKNEKSRKGNIEDRNVICIVRGQKDGRLFLTRWKLERILKFKSWQCFPFHHDCHPYNTGSVLVQCLSFNKDVALLSSFPILRLMDQCAIVIICVPHFAFFMATLINCNSNVILRVL